MFKTKWLKKREKIQPTAVPLDALPERCTMTMYHEISARGSLMPAGDGSALFCHKDSTTNWQFVCNLLRFQDLVYAENSDVICVNEIWLNQNISNSEILHSGFTIYVICVNEIWLNQNISNSEILHSGFTIFRRDRSDRGGGGVLIAIKTASFKAVKEFNLNRKPSCNSLKSFLPKLLRLLVKEFYSVLAIGHPMKAQVGWMYWIIFCM